MIASAGAQQPSQMVNVSAVGAQLAAQLASPIVAPVVAPAVSPPLFYRVPLPFQIPALPIPAFPGPGRDVRDGVLTFYLDNDLFGGTDENYTNGGRLSWISRNRDLSEIPAVQRSFARLTGFEDKAGVYYNYGFSLTQLIFTPRDILPSEPLPDQRPYAGWLGAGFSLHVKSDDILNSAEVSVGIGGPSSLAENAQDLIHALRDVEKANGWENQIPNEVTLNLHFEQKRKLHNRKLLSGLLNLESFTKWGFDIGNLRTSAHTGAEVRLGYRLPVDFSSPRLDVTAYSHQVFGEDSSNVGKLGLFVFAGIEGEVVGHDLFLDGPVFSSGPSVERTPLVGEISFGGGIRYDRITVSYAHTYRTAQFETQDDDQFFGSLAISVAF